MNVRLVRTSHHVEEDEPDGDGNVDWRYEYDLYVLAVGGLEITARSYVEDPSEISLLQFDRDGAPLGLDDVVEHRSEAIAAAAFLRERGFTTVRWLRSSGYVDLPE